MKNSNDNIGNRTRDLPACSTVPQPTAPPPMVSLTTACLRAGTFRIRSTYTEDVTVLNGMFRFQNLYCVAMVTHDLLR
jgi:hypothetical protein